MKDIDQERKENSSLSTPKSSNTGALKPKSGLLPYVDAFTDGLLLMVVKSTS